MSGPAEEREVVVVGGGILGLFSALALREQGFDVEVFVSPLPEPRTDSQRNHAWLQSGLLYGPDLESARSMYLAGREMLEHVGAQLPSTRGVFRFPGEDEAREFEMKARHLRLYEQIRRLPDGEAEQLLGIFYQPGKVQYQVPDTPFDERYVMESARRQALALGVRFLEGHVAALPSSQTPSGYLLKINGRTVIPQVCVVCAGAGTPTILEGLGIEHPLLLNQSALLVFDGAEGLSIPLLADRESGLAVVRWSSAQVPPYGCLVVGGADRRILSADEGCVRRKVEPAQIEQLIKLLPPQLRDQSFRVTAGHKTDCLRGNQPTVDPWIHAPDRFPGLLFATPGKATLSFRTALAVVRTVNKCIQDSQGVREEERVSSETIGPAWTAPIRPHFDSSFDEMNDRDDTEGTK
jgi:glycine/D-amino acid oxidase-like deaminating enzyme